MNAGPAKEEGKAPCRPDLPGFLDVQPAQVDEVTREKA